MSHKTQRLLDLIAFLSGRRYPVSVEQIMGAVPQYAERWTQGTDTDRVSIRRTFERDKEELREIGVPIRSVPLPGQDLKESPQGYLLARRDFYLPYVRLLGARHHVPPRAPSIQRSNGHSALNRSLAEPFEIAEHEISAALEGLAQLADLPDCPLVEDARSAYRKLTFDLDHGRFRSTPVFHASPHTPDVAETLEVLFDARHRRKRVTFRYHGLGSTVTERSVAPYGVYYRNGNWYLFGLDTLREAERTFRVSRMDGLALNRASPKTPDYEIPSDFDLRAVARREAWELGSEEDPPTTVRVLFHPALSRWAERNRFGTFVERRESGSSVREFQVRDIPAFLRWTLSLEGRAQVLSPVGVQRAWQRTARRVAVLHAEVRHA